MQKVLNVASQGFVVDTSFYILRVKMIELHYGHLQPAQKANVIEGKRMGSKKKVVAAEAVAEEKPKLERVK
jgi:hypothetical protein